MGKVNNARKIVDDFVEFGNSLAKLENPSEYYYWMTEAILRAAEAIKKEEEQ